MTQYIDQWGFKNHLSSISILKKYEMFTDKNWWTYCERKTYLWEESWLREPNYGYDYDVGRWGINNYLSLASTQSIENLKEKVSYAKRNCC